jgi:hypothetical protein
MLAIRERPRGYRKGAMKSVLAYALVLVPWKSCGSRFADPAPRKRGTVFCLHFLLLLLLDFHVTWAGKRAQ